MVGDRPRGSRAPAARVMSPALIVADEQDKEVKNAAKAGVPTSNLLELNEQGLLLCGIRSRMKVWRAGCQGVGGTSAGGRQ